MAGGRGSGILVFRNVISLRIINDKVKFCAKMGVMTL